MKKILGLLLVTVLALGLFACDGNGNTEEKTDAEKVALAKTNLALGFTGSDSASSVTSNLTLRPIQDGVAITWSSSNKTVITDAGKVTRPEDNNAEVTMTASLKLNDATDTKDFLVTVIAEEEQGNVDLALPAAFNDAAAGKHVYISSIGQAGELATLNTLLSRYVFTETAEYNEKVTNDSMLQANSVTAGSIVILVPGASSKGLGAAGTNLTAELARANAFKERASKGEIVLYVVHLGGEARRGTDTDPLISACVANASLVLVEVTGNSDGFFDSLGNSSVYYYSQPMKLSDPFKQIFNK